MRLASGLEPCSVDLSSSKSRSFSLPSSSGRSSNTSLPPGPLSSELRGERDTCFGLISDADLIGIEDREAGRYWPLKADVGRVGIDDPLVMVGLL